MAATNLHLHHDLGVRPGLGVHPGQSDPTRMLGSVLLLLAVVVPMAALALAWLLA